MTFTPDWSFNIEYICAAILSILHICINLHSPELQCQLTRKQNMLTNNDTTNNDKQEGQKEKERKKEERVNKKKKKKEHSKKKTFYNTVIHCMAENTDRYNEEREAVKAIIRKGKKGTLLQQRTFRFVRSGEQKSYQAGGRSGTGSPISEGRF